MSSKVTKVRKMNEVTEDSNSFLSDVISIWKELCQFLGYNPTRNSYKRKLRALLEGLETQNVDKLMKEGKTDDFRNYGKSYINAVRDKVESAKTSSLGRPN